jgi:hypothetical protein
MVAIGSDIGPGSRPLIQLVEAETGTVVAETLAFEEAFRGGTRLAMANVDGRPGNEIVIGSGPGRVAEICVFTIDGVEENTRLRELPEFRLRPFGNSYFGGIAVAAGEVNGDSHADIAAAKSRGSEVSVFLSPAFGGSISQTPYQTFVPFGGGALGGAALAFADVGTFVNGSLVDGTKADGLAELAVATGTGMKPVVKIYDLSGATARTVDRFTPFTPALVGGMSVAAGRYDANQIDDVIVTSGSGGRRMPNSPALPRSRALRPRRRPRLLPRWIATATGGSTASERYRGSPAVAVRQGLPSSASRGLGPTCLRT